MESAAVARSVALALLLLTAGCLDGGPIGDTTTADGGDGGWSLTASDRPDADKAVHLENYWNDTVDVEVRVVRERTGETVHEETYELRPGEEVVAYNLSDADPEGIESFRVVVTARNETGEITIETNDCYGDAYAEIQDDGDLSVYYAIC